jgi:hypothetical protein
VSQLAFNPPDPLHSLRSLRGKGTGVARSRPASPEVDVLRTRKALYGTGFAGKPEDVLCDCCETIWQ